MKKNRLFIVSCSFLGIIAETGSVINYNELKTPEKIANFIDQVREVISQNPNEIKTKVNSEIDGVCNANLNDNEKIAVLDSLDRDLGRKVVIVRKLAQEKIESLVGSETYEKHGYGESILKWILEDPKERCISNYITSAFAKLEAQNLDFLRSNVKKIKKMKMGMYLPRSLYTTTQAE